MLCVLGCELGLLCSQVTAGGSMGSVADPQACVAPFINMLPPWATSFSTQSSTIRMEASRMELQCRCESHQWVKWSLHGHA